MAGNASGQYSARITIAVARRSPIPPISSSPRRAACAAACQAVQWQNGVPVKLQDFVEPGFADHLWSARSINEAGQITGRLIEQGTGKWVTYVATPIR